MRKWIALAVVSLGLFNAGCGGPKGPVVLPPDQQKALEDEYTRQTEEDARAQQAAEKGKR